MFERYKGKMDSFVFLPKDNTPGCTTEACEFTEAEPDFSKLDAIILGVSPDSPKKHRNFIDKKELGITLLSDEDKEVLQVYDVWKLKKMYADMALANEALKDVIEKKL